VKKGLPNIFHRTFLEFLLAALFLICPIPLLAQAVIHGNVVDTSGKPFVNANVLLLRSPDSVLVLGKLTNEAGIFRFENIYAGIYLVSCTYTSDKPAYSAPIEVSGADKMIDLGNIRFEEKIMQMKEVVVVAKKPLYEQKIDRLVIPCRISSCRKTIPSVSLLIII